MSKTRSVFTLILLLMLLAVALPVQGQSEDFNWRQFEGTEIRGIMIQGPWINSAQAHIDAFEEATGISVTLDILPEAEAWDKMRVEMQAQNQNLDVFFNQTSTLGLEFLSNAWVEPLNDYIADPAKTNAEFDWENDFLQYSKDGVSFDGVVVAIPTDRNLGPMMFYRKDLLEEYGVEVPTTLEELREAAIKIWEDSGNTIPGIVYRGSGNSATSHYAHVMHEFGAAWEDADGHPTVNTPEHIAAFKWYGDTLREAGSVGATAFAFPETVNAFLTGNAAFTLELGINPSNVSNSDTSSVVGLVGYTVIPRGPGPEENRYTEPCRPLRPFGISISAFSQKKDAAWLFVQWMTGFDAQLDYLKAGRVAARSTPWSSTEFEESLSEDDREYWQAQQVASGFCYPTLGHAPPSLRDQGRARDIIGQVIETAILGGDVEAAAAMAQEELDMLWARQQN